MKQESKALMMKALEEKLCKLLPRAFGEAMESVEWTPNSTAKWIAQEVLTLVQPKAATTSGGDDVQTRELAEALEGAKSAFALFVEQFPSPETSHVDYRVRCARVSEEAIRDIDAALAKARASGLV